MANIELTPFLFFWRHVESTLIMYASITVVLGISRATRVDGDGHRNGTFTVGIGCLEGRTPIKRVIYCAGHSNIRLILLSISNMVVRDSVINHLFSFPLPLKNRLFYFSMFSFEAPIIEPFFFKLKHLLRII